MRNISRAIGTVAMSLLPALLPPVAAQGSGAGKTDKLPHAVVMICGAYGSAGTNLLTLYLQGISSDDPIALAIVGVPTQPPPGVDCAVALAKLMALDKFAPPPSKPNPVAVQAYKIQAVVTLEHSLVFTLVTQ